MLHSHQIFFSPLFLNFSGSAPAGYKLTKPHMCMLQFKINFRLKYFQTSLIYILLCLIIKDYGKYLEQMKKQIKLQSNLDYPDFSIIRTLFSGPNFCMNINKLSS